MSDSPPQIRRLLTTTVAQLRGLQCKDVLRGVIVTNSGRAVSILLVEYPYVVEVAEQLNGYAAGNHIY